ncbi:Flp family type IVb pilin [Allorhizobium terrae]|uniref:Flp family type IVb pilin n=1 Tax=Allorhizobium terrae TaxID=1848972 RepID=A0A4S3ZW42_9HYPH|nr:Flp family type IVb pilin [Allorhizobium terrae]THF50013.1 Flp family type IVb pilin [Allorhizobium terrae]TWD53571.1 pilus assembly protein Flp/PilA [Agrobacterium vitis]
MLFKCQFGRCHVAMLLRGFIQSQSGATAVEYSLLAAIIAVSLYLALGEYYKGMNNLFDFIVTTVSNALA